MNTRKVTVPLASDDGGIPTRTRSRKLGVPHERTYNCLSHICRGFGFYSSYTLETIADCHPLFLAPGRLASARRFFGE